MCAPVRPRPCVRGSFGAGSVMSVIGPPKAYEKRAIRVRGVCHGSVMRPPEVCHAPPDSLPSGPGCAPVQLDGVDLASWRGCSATGPSGGRRWASWLAGAPRALAGDGRTFTTSRAAGARCRPVRSEGRARSWTRAAPTSRPCDRRSDVAHHEARSATPATRGAAPRGRASGPTSRACSVDGGRGGKGRRAMPGGAASELDAGPTSRATARSPASGRSAASWPGDALEVAGCDAGALVDVGAVELDAGDGPVRWGP